MLPWGLCWVPTLSSCWFLCIGEHWVSTRGPCWTGGYGQDGGQGAAAGHNPFSHPTLWSGGGPGASIHPAPGAGALPTELAGAEALSQQAPSWAWQRFLFSQSCQKLCGFPSLPSHKLAFTSPYGSLAGSSPVSHRLPLLSSCLQVPNQNVAPQYLRGRSSGTARRLWDSQWARVPLLGWHWMQMPTFGTGHSVPLAMSAWHREHR